MTREAVIVSAVRTPIGTLGGTLGRIRPEIYGAEVVKEVIRRIDLDPNEIEDAIFGNAFRANGNIAHHLTLRAGLPMSIPGITIDRQCSSGLNAVNYAAESILAGTADVYLAGGVESQSLQPHIMERTDFFSRTPPPFRGRGILVPIDMMEDPAMGLTAENLVEKYNISRLEQDEFALRSQQNWGRANAAGEFKSQILPIAIPQKKGDPKIFDTDEHPRPSVTLEQLSKLPPAFKKGGSVTAGNSSGVNDAAAALIVMSSDRAKALGLKPMAKVRSFAYAGVEPKYMGIGPVPATNKALKRAGLTLKDMDLIEANEAFAAQCLACDRELHFDMSKVNVQGGAIAHGHPVGASGACLATKMVYMLQQRDVKYGLITMCIGGGQGIATIFEKVE